VPAKPCIQWITGALLGLKQPWREADHSLQSRPRLRMSVAIPLISLCAFVLWTRKTSSCLVKNFVAILELKYRNVFSVLVVVLSNLNLTDEPALSIFTLSLSKIHHTVILPSILRFCRGSVPPFTY